jgi:anti-sigma factor RsiW
MSVAPGCKRFLESLGDHIDGTLAGRARLEFDRHVQACRLCQILRATVRKTIHYYKDREPSPVPSDVESRFWNALENRMRSSRDPNA